MLASVSLLLLVLAHNLSAQERLSLKDAVVKGEVVLSPASVSDKITDVTWKHNNDIALEWFGNDVTSYREFKGRTTLDKTNGVLTIKNLILMLSGTYTAEINNQIVSSQEVKIYDQVPKPTLTRTYREKENSYVFTCNNSAPANAQPVKLKWKINDVEQPAPGPQELTIQGKENCSFVCELSNPVSNQYSDVVENPSCGDTLDPASIIGIVIGVLILVFLPFLLFFYVVFVRKPSRFKDNPTIKVLQNSAFGKRVDGCFSPLKGSQDGAAARENKPLNRKWAEDSSANPGANGTSDKREDEKSAPEEDQN